MLHFLTPDKTIIAVENIDQIYSYNDLRSYNYENFEVISELLFQHAAHQMSNPKKKYNHC